MTFTENKRETIKYWEKKRVTWNLLLVPPAIFSYWLASGFAVGIGDLPTFGWPMVAVMFCCSAAGANICYSFAYVVEFWIQGEQVETSYRERGRKILFVLGCFLGIGLALCGGTSIAQMQYPV